MLRLNFGPYQDWKTAAELMFCCQLSDQRSRPRQQRLPIRRVVPCGGPPTVGWSAPDFASLELKGSQVAISIRQGICRRHRQLFPSTGSYQPKYSLGWWLLCSFMMQMDVVSPIYRTRRMLNKEKLVVKMRNDESLQFDMILDREIQL